MKLTLVIDTEDPEGIADAHKVVSHFKRKYVAGSPISHKLTYGKIKHIKMLRTFAKAVIEEYTSGDEDPTGLKFTKHYTERLIKQDPDYPGI